MCGSRPESTIVIIYVIIIIVIIICVNIFIYVRCTAWVQVGQVRVHVVRQTESLLRMAHEVRIACGDGAMHLVAAA